MAPRVVAGFGQQRAILGFTPYEGLVALVVLASILGFPHPQRNTSDSNPISGKGARGWNRGVFKPSWFGHDGMVSIARCGSRVWLRSGDDQLDQRGRA